MGIGADGGVLVWTLTPNPHQHLQKVQCQVDLSQAGSSARESGPLASALHWHPYPSVGDKSIIKLGIRLGYPIADVPPFLAYNPG